MKSKLLLFIIFVAFMLSVIFPAVAASVVDITRPEGNEIVTKDIFPISGVCANDETTISFEYKDRESGEYKPLLTVDGETSFKVGNSKIFSKNVQLKYKGDNEIRIIANTKTIQGKPKDYTITVVDEKKEEKKKGNWIEAAIKWLTDFGKEETKK